MAKKFMVHARRIVKLAVILTFMSKYFTAPLPAMKKHNFLVLENTHYIMINKAVHATTEASLTEEGLHWDNL